MDVVEKYARAIGSSHLEVTEFAGDVDALIASGWIKDGLATRLYRLRVEYDRADKKAAGNGGWKAGADRLRVIVAMPSLKLAKVALEAFVMQQATRQDFEGAADKQLWIAGRILENFLNSNCTECTGRKEKEVPGTGRLSGVACKMCEGTGARRLGFFGNTPYAEVLFTRGIQADIDRKMDRVNKLMARFLRERAEA